MNISSDDHYNKGVMYSILTSTKCLRFHLFQQSMSLQALKRLTRANASKKIHPGKLINLNPGFQCPHIMMSKSQYEI